MKKNSIINHISYNKLLQEFHPTKNGDLKLSDFSYGSHEKIWWKCVAADDHEYEATINHRVQGRGCPFCSGKKVAKSNALSTTNPEIAKEWHPIKNTLTPDDITFGSEKKVWWKCSVAEDHEWETTVKHRSSGNGCPCCSGYKVVDSNSLATQHQELAKEWHPTKNKELTPNDVSGGHRKVWWMCSNNSSHQWRASLKDRIRGRRCPHCHYPKSKGHIKIEQLLYDNDISFETEKRFENCVFERVLRFDFYIPKLNVLIEYDGRQHTNAVDIFGGEEELIKTQKRDKIKDEYAKNNNIHLLRISHKEFKNIEPTVLDYISNL